MKTILIQVEAKIETDTRCSFDCHFLNGELDYCMAFQENLKKEIQTLHGDYQLLAPVRCDKCVKIGKEII